MPGPGNISYCQPSDLLNYLPAATLNLATNDQQLAACASATSTADGFLFPRYTMPILTPFDAELVRYTAYIAIYELMTGPIGLAPQAGSDQNITRRYFEAVGGTIDNVRYDGWFPRIQRQALSPNIVPSIPLGSDPIHDLPQVNSQPMRGWQQVNRRGTPVVGGF